MKYRPEDFRPNVKAKLLNSKSCAMTLQIAAEAIFNLCRKIDRSMRMALGLTGLVMPMPARLAPRLRQPPQAPNAPGVLVVMAV
jgi:hypothetical protein